MPFLTSLPPEAGPPSIYTKYPDIYGPWSRMSEALMNGPSPLSQGERELILAYAAAATGCEGVYRAHSEVAYEWGIPRGALEQLQTNPNTPALTDNVKALLAFVRKLAITPGETTQEDVNAVLAAGWNEDALHDAIAITARAAFMHRLIAGYGFRPLSPENAIQRAKKRVEQGYFDLYPSLKESKQ